MFRLPANHWRPQDRLSHTHFVRTYREVFALPEFRVLFLVRCVTMAAISIGSLALGATTYASTGSPVLTALSMFGGPLITLIGSATVLSASDSMGPRRASTIMPIAYAVAFFLQALPHLPWGWRFAILAIPFLAGSATSGSTMRLLHDIVPPDGFVLGRATLNIAVGVMQVAGYGFGGLLLVWFSPATLFLIAGVAAVAAALIIRLGVGERPGVVSSQGLVTRTRAVNRLLLGSPVTRPLYLAMWVPNGLIVGCEALFVPYAGQAGAGYLFAATAAGMLVGDVVVGRFVPPRHRDRIIEPLRMLLALPYLGFLFSPSLTIALVLGFVASAGYSASLPLQERLVGVAGPETRGQAFGLYSTGLMAGQAIGATIGGVLASRIGATHAVGTLAVASACITAALAPGLRRSAPATRSTMLTG
jgi:predicted MFS family arabinose efflux permease